MNRDEVEPYLLACRWFRDYSEQIFGEFPDAFVGPFMDEMIRSRAAAWDGDRLVAGAPYRVPAPGWQTAPGNPLDWPAVETHQAVID